MAAPAFVPIDPTEIVRKYSSPPRRPGTWKADRPGDLVDGQPRGARLGTQGPDQGYVYKLLGLFDDRLHLGAVNRNDAVAGCCALAMRRSALFGRGPVVHDLTAAFTIFGFLDENPADDLVRLREEVFSQIRSNHHYVERREVVDMVTEEALRQDHQDIITSYGVDWHRNLHQ